MAATKNEIMTLKEVAEYLQCHQTTIYRFANEGRIPAFRLGGGWRVQRAALEAWMARQDRGGGQ